MLSYATEIFCKISGFITKYVILIGRCHLSRKLIKGNNENVGEMTGFLPLE